VGRFPAACLLAAALALAATDARAIGEAEKGDYSIEAVGSARLTGAYLHYPDVTMWFPPEDEGLVGTVLRLILDGSLGPYLGYDVNLYTNFSYMPSSELGGAFASAGSFETPYRTRYLAWEFWESGGLAGQMGVDRLALDLEVDRVTLTVGRFPVNHSVTSMFTPNDFFAPFSPTAINTIYKPGVDAVQLGVTTGLLSSVEVVGVMGYGSNDAPSWGRTAVLARASTVLWNFEWALLGGKVAERWIVGGSFQGEIGPIGVRGEGHAGFPDVDGDCGLDDDVHGRLSAGLDVVLAWRNVSLGAEYMFLSDGAGRTSRYIDRLLSFFPDDQLFLGQHYVGLSAGMDLVPILRLNTMLLFNATDYSGLAAIMFLYSIADEADAVFGLMVPWGDEPLYDSGPPTYGPSIESEYGMMPLVLYLETRFYF
jgi:hypothetical protein